MATSGNAANLLRERETYRYLDLSYIHGYVSSTNDPVPAARPSRDTALTAFTQLALLKLGAHRSFVSLFDRKYQYIIAETTSASTLKSFSDKDTGEGLLVCGLGLARSQGVSSLVLDAASTSLSVNLEPHDWIAPVVFVPDMQADERFNQSRFVKLFNDIRFYASVPILSPANRIIGTLTITDDKPRQEFDANATRFMQHMATTIMDHLSMIRYRQEEVRGKRMMRGLSSFVEGRSTISGLLPDQWSTDCSGKEGLLNATQQAKMQEEDERIQQDNVFHEIDHRPHFSSVTKRKQSVQALSPLTRSRTGSADMNGSTLGSQTHASEPVTQSSSPKDPAPSSSLHDINDLFSRAANTIRESLEVEGVLFFDASITAFGGMVGFDRHDSDPARSMSASSGEEPPKPARKRTKSFPSDTNVCRVFGFSTTDTASIDGDKPITEYVTVPERFLHLLCNRYPRGKIFNFDEKGVSLSDSESDFDAGKSTVGAKAPTSHGQSYSRTHAHHSFARGNEPSFIIKIFPDARSVLAVPLWDSHRSRWYAGAVAWTRTPTRVFTVKQELSYLRAFGATIMAEVARIDAQYADQAKADVLGSISHELRSPLHGILGGVELLQDTDMDLFQNSTVHTIEKCGLTLLDTIDHLLDFTKINNLKRSSTSKAHTRAHESNGRSTLEVQRASMPGACDVDVDIVVEEVIESVFAGYEFQKSSHSVEKASSGLTSIEPRADNTNVTPLHKQARLTSDGTLDDHVKIILDIRPASSWRFTTEAGAIRRVVMNIFGNALKYTASGHIKVTVDQKDLTSNSSALSEVSITVEDTGRGIGKEYLSHHVFTAFSQEDSMSPGIGLGLSLTKRIVKYLGGTLNIKSEVGKGTVVFVLLPLLRPTNEDMEHERSDFAESITRTRGLRASLCGFSESVSAGSHGPGHGCDSWRLLGAIVARQCEQWHGMMLLPPNSHAVKPDLYVSSPASAAALMELNNIGVLIQPVVVLCPTAEIARESSIRSKTKELPGVFEYIPQPCGPRKLAKIITLALNRWADIQVQNAGPPIDLPRRSSIAPIRVMPPFNPLSITPLRSRPDTNLEQNLQHDDSLSALSRPSTSSELTQVTYASIGNPTQQLHSLKANSRKLSSDNGSRQIGLAEVISTTKQGEGSLPLENIAPYLVVDDSAINVRLLTGYLKRQQLPTVTASDGTLAVAAYKAARGAFSCILMDIQMPNLDGMAATRAIREHEAREGLKPVYIVILSGLASMQVVEEAKASGANEYFPKPVRLKSLGPVLASSVRTIGGSE